jgi:hypothetical protein
MAMTIDQFRALSAAEARRQRRLQVNAMVAARSAQIDAKAFEKMVKALSND